MGIRVDSHGFRFLACLRDFREWVFDMKDSSEKLRLPDIHIFLMWWMAGWIVKFVIGYFDLGNQESVAWAFAGVFLVACVHIIARNRK